MTVRIIEGDCRHVLRELPEKSVHCCITSPPYFGLRDYGTATWEGGDPACAHRGRDARTAPPGTAKQASSFGANNVYRIAPRPSRSATMIELNPAYAAMAKSRIVGDAPLFAQVVAA